MPDITMCKTETCLKKDKCYRYIAPPDKLQSYADFTTACNSENDKDNYFWPVREGAYESNIFRY